MAKALALLLTFTLLSLLCIYLFLNSTYAVPVFTAITGRATGRDVLIDKISAGLSEGLTLKGLQIGHDNERLAALDSLQIRAHLTGLATGRLVSIYVVNPILYYSALKTTAPMQEAEKSKDNKAREDGAEGPSIPWFIKDIVISGLVIRDKPVKTPEENPALIGPLTLSLMAARNKKTALKVNSFLPLLKTSASIEGTLDLGELSLFNGGLDLGEIKLEDIDAGGLSIIRGAAGTVKARVEFTEDEGKVKATLKGAFRGLSLPTLAVSEWGPARIKAVLTMSNNFSKGELQAGLFINKIKTGRMEQRLASINACYERGKKTLKIKEASLTFPAPPAREAASSGTMGITGEILGVPGSEISVDIRLRADKLSLSILNNFIPKPLSIAAADKGEERGVSGSVHIRGVLQVGLRWDAALRLSDNLAYGPYLMALEKTPLFLDSQGIYLPGSGEIKLDFLRAEAGKTGPLTMKGRIKGLAVAEPDIDLILQGNTLDLTAVKSLIPLAGLADMELRGTLESKLHLTGTAGSPVIKGRVSAKKVFLKGRGLELFSTGADLGFTYDRGILNLKDFRAKADSLRGSAAESPKPQLQGITLLIPSAAYDGVSIKIKNIKLKAKKILLLDDKRPLFTEQDFTLSGAISGDLLKNRFQAERFTFSAGEDRAITGQISDILLDLTSPARVGLTVNIHDLPVDKLTPRLLKLAGLGEVAEAAGALDTGLKIKIMDWSRAEAKIKMGLKEGAFSTEEGNLAAEGLWLNSTGKLDMELPPGKINFSMEAEAGGFELLANSFYGDFKDRPVRLRAHGSYEAATDTLLLPSLSLKLSPMAELTMRATLSSLRSKPRIEDAAASLNISNKESYDFFIRQTFMESMPMLERLETDGETGLSVKIRGTTEALSLKGELKLTGAGIKEKSAEADNEGEDGLSVMGVNLRLPLELAYPGPKKAGNMDFGSLGIEYMRLGPMEVYGLKASPVIKGNALSFAGAIKIPLFGGAVSLDEVVFKDLLSSRRVLTLKMNVDDIELGKAGTALGLPPFEGTLSGRIPGIRLAGNHLATEGEMSLKVFGGEVRIKDMAVDNVFSPVTALKSSIDIEDLDLGALTGAFEFGSITGMLRGRIKDLVIVQSQPESFFVDIHTVKKRGLAQRISTKALENVSILGTGAAASVLNRGIYSLFNEYRYKKMGFQGQLKNDELLLLGIETQGDKGYIIKGAAIPPRVDVVSFTERISFKEMIKRLEGVNFSSAAAE